MSAVFGGIYCLRHSVSCLIVDKDSNRCKAVIDSRGQRISCSHFVVEDGFVGRTGRWPRPPGVSGHGSSDRRTPAVNMVELSPSTMTCIPGTYLVHLTCRSVGSAYEDLSPVVTRMFRTAECQDQENCPAVLWCLYFNMADGSGVEPEGHDLPSNVYVCSGPDGALGHEHAMKQAELIFLKILPEEEFCPPAPNPEDIIYDGENTSPTSTGEEQEEGLTAAGGGGETAGAAGGGDEPSA